MRRGQSIAGYKRPELVEIVGRIADREPDLTDDQIVELVTRLLACPEDEALLVGARLRYAVELHRRAPVALSTGTCGGPFWTVQT